jgi:hypothetical protein
MRRWRIPLSGRSQTEICVLDNTAQGLGQGKKQGHLEDSRQEAGGVAWDMGHGAWGMGHGA